MSETSTDETAETIGLRMSRQLPATLEEVGDTMTTHVVVTFEPVDRDTLMTVEQTDFPTPEVRDFFESMA